MKLVGYKYQLQNKQQKNNMTDYKALYEQQLQENKKLQEEVQDIHQRVIHTDIENVELKAENKEMNELWEKDKKKVIELRKQVEYWKDFALLYWSGYQLGDVKGGAVGCSVWQEALEEVNSNEDADREELTKKCMECDY